MSQPTTQDDHNFHHICHVNFSIIGTGNAAYHFTMMLRQHGHNLLQVCSRVTTNAFHFTQAHGGQAIATPSMLSSDNDIVIIAVADDQISTVARAIPSHLKVIHTSGMTPMNVITYEERGVVWPMQTLTAGKEINYSNIPLLVEASSTPFNSFLLSVFSQISSEVHQADSVMRAKSHLAAVFASNFVNQMYDIAGELISEGGLDFRILLPIIEEAALKVRYMPTSESQTGPARRGDINTIANHLAMLEDRKDLVDIYKAITNRILHQFHE